MFDVDLDGKLDLLATSDESGLSYFLNQGATFAPRVDLSAGANALSIVYQDFDGDCLPDLATVSGSGGVASVMLNKSQ